MDAAVSLNDINSVDFHLYPNPIESAIHIDAEENLFSIEILDLSGRVIYKTKPNAQSFIMDVSWLESGSYIIEVQFADLSLRKMIFKN